MRYRASKAKHGDGDVSRAVHIEAEFLHVLRAGGHEV